jgi:hypothetical protein
MFILVKPVLTVNNETPTSCLLTGHRNMGCQEISVFNIGRISVKEAK